MSRVYFVEGFNEIPKEIKECIVDGYTVYNAPRPLLGHKTWQGDFRHGVFYAAVLPENSPADEFNDAPTFHKRNKELDGHVCQIVTRQDVMAYGQMMADEYSVDIEEFDYDDIVKSYVGWLIRQNEK